MTHPLYTLSKTRGPFFIFFQDAHIIHQLSPPVTPPWLASRIPRIHGTLEIHRGPTYALSNKNDGKKWFRRETNDHKEYEFMAKMMRKMVQTMKSVVETLWKIMKHDARFRVLWKTTLSYEEYESWWGSLASLSVFSNFVAGLDSPSLFPLRSLGHKSLGAAARKESLLQSTTSKWFIFDF